MKAAYVVYDPLNDQYLLSKSSRPRWGSLNRAKVYTSKTAAKNSIKWSSKHNNEFEIIEVQLTLTNNREIYIIR